MNSPFSEGVFEYDSKHCFYLPRAWFADLEVHKPVYLIGSRGSGKTTLLMSLNWRERMNNQTLLRQLGGDPFRGLYIGTYVKLPKIQLRTFEKWLAHVDDDIHGLLLGLYFDLVFLETASQAVSELLAAGKFNISSATESSSVSAWVSDCREVLPGLDCVGIDSVAAFSQFIRYGRRRLEHHARTRTPPADTLAQFAPSQIGVFGTTIAQQIADLCNHDTLGQSERWHFKICMDEGECLSGFQQLVVNTIVRLAEWPLFPVVSYVSRPADITTTLVPKLTHQKADRHLIVLDTMDRSEFIELAEGVASVRCQEEVQDPDVVFRSATILGRLNINGLLARVIETSESPDAATFIDNAKEFAAATGYDTSRALPIYQAYLAAKLDLSITPNGDRKKERHQESQQYRKKMVAAFLAICHELKRREIPYASADMVFGISDNCVRDFLSQLHHVFRESTLPLEEFLQRQINSETQSRAIHAASAKKRDSIPGSGVLSPVEAGRVIRGLAMVTAAIQASSDDDCHLRSIERGRFRLVGKAHQASEVDDAMELVRDAADAGFFRIFGKDDVQLFRVHASLAPAYGFSYRGAQYPVNLALDDFNDLKAAKTHDELEAVARAIAKGVPPEPEDFPLFPWEEEDDED